jgi:hypothetical protein
MAALHVGADSGHNALEFLAPQALAVKSISVAALLS